MKENRYDDKVFFDKYSSMDRSTKGLAGAGEWPALKKVLPSFRGKAVLDLGCGFGWHCAYALDQGAERAVGVDISSRMLAEGRRKFPEVDFIEQSIEEVYFPNKSFDVIVSSLAFHYLESFEDICRKAANWLRPDGDFVFSVEHPVFTAQGPQDWIYGPDGSKLYWPVDSYFSEGMRRAIFLGEELIKYHRTVESYIAGPISAGFQIKALVEPTPDEELLSQVEGMKDELRRPMMLILSCHLPELESFTL